MQGTGPASRSRSGPVGRPAHTGRGHRREGTGQMIVNLSGTFAKDKRPDNGLDEIGDKLNTDRLMRIPVAGLVEYHGHHETVGRPEYISVRFVALEPVFDDAAEQVRQILDQARKQRGLGQVEL